MHEEGAWRAKEVAAAEDAVAATLALLPALLRALETNAATAAAAAADAAASSAPGSLGGGPLARALLVEAPWGGPPLAAAVASYAAYPYAAACCPLALPALAALCERAPAEPPLACALPSLAPRGARGFGFSSTLSLPESSASASASARTLSPSETGGGAAPDALDARAAVVRALAPGAARADPAAARAAAAFLAAAAARQPMLAEALLLPARLGADVRAEEARADGDGDPGDVPASALDSLWACLGEAAATRASDPRALAATTRAMAALYGAQSRIGGREGAAAAVNVLRSRPFELVARLEACLPPFADDGAEEREGDDDDDEAEAHRFAAEADATAMLAAETAAARREGRLTEPAETSAAAAAAARWCARRADGGESALLGWLRRWLKPRRAAGVFSAARSRAHAVTLRAAAEAERAAATRAVAGFGAPRAASASLAAGTPPMSPYALSRQHRLEQPSTAARGPHAAVPARLPPLPQ